jgi:saccharopine dehydrogenase-like NADP-dependent oxidoreductase
MTILVLGGAGLQGRAVLHDLSRSPEVKEIVCADLQFDGLSDFKKFLDMKKIKLQKLDVSDKDALKAVLKDGVDVTIVMLPHAVVGPVAEAAIETRVPMVETMYGHMLPKGIHERALEKGVIIMPESGLDPGIDLVLCGYAVSRLEKVTELHSYCGGFPEAQACDNPLKYKISWTWNGVLLSYKRPARMVRDGKVVQIPARDQFAERWIGKIDFPGFGELEVIPNGDAVIFAELLGISKTIRNTSRCTLRWPGHSAFWKKLVDLNFLSDEPVKGLPGEITPHQFMVKHLEPQLQYREKERDVVVMRNTIVGLRKGVPTRITFDLVDMRDLETGLFAMNRTVGYTASIIAQMIVKGEIKGAGVLTPVKDIPYKSFLEKIRQRGIVIKETVETVH